MGNVSLCQQKKSVNVVMKQFYITWMVISEVDQETPSKLEIFVTIDLWFPDNSDVTKGSMLNAMVFEFQPS